MAEEYSIVWLDHIISTHSSVDGHLDCFHLLFVVNIAAMNIHVPMLNLCLQIHLFGYIPRSEIIQSCSNSAFNFSKNH